MNFFEQQKKARSKTKLLVFLFILSTVMTAFLVVAFCSFVLAPDKIDKKVSTGFFYGEMEISLFIWVCLIILGMSLIKYLNLKGGGDKVAERLGGVPLTYHTQNLNKKKVLNVVEEMSIASGVAMPQVYLLKGQKGINAFAAGFGIHDAVICVTEGAIEKLTRDELQAVVAHEFSHIFNGDMKLNMQLIGVLAGILAISEIGRSMLRSYPRASPGSIRRKSGSKGVGIGLVFFAIGIVGYFFGKLIKAAISRQREFLADASAVQFTRNPGAVTSVFKKIALSEDHSYLNHDKAEEFSHMFFADGYRSFFSSFLATHPSIEERIRVFEPGFQLKKMERSPLQSLKVEPPQFRKSLMMTEKLRYLCGDLTGAQCILYSFTLHSHESQKDAFWEKIDEKTKTTTLRIFYENEAYIKKNQLFLYNLCAPTLRQLSVSAQKDFYEKFLGLVKADQKVEPIELVLVVLLKKILFKRTPKTMLLSESNSLLQVSAEVALVLSYFCFILNPAKDWQSIYQEQLKIFGLDRRVKTDFKGHLSRVSLESIVPALEKTSFLNPTDKNRFLDVLISLKDSELNESQEAQDMLRAICECFEAPLPHLQAERQKIDSMVS